MVLYGWFWPALPGSGLLICWPTCPCLVDWLWPELHLIYLSLTWFLLEETLSVLLLCLTLSPFRVFFTQNCQKKKKRNHQYYTNGIFNSHIIVWLKTKSLNVKLFLYIANENKCKTTSKNVCLFNTIRYLLFYILKFQASERQHY